MIFYSRNPSRQVFLEKNLKFSENLKGFSGKYVPIRSDLTTESAEEAQKHTEKKEEKRHSERVLTRISRKAQKKTRNRS